MVEVVRLVGFSVTQGKSNHEPEWKLFPTSAQGHASTWKTQRMKSRILPFSMGHDHHQGEKSS